MPTIKTYTPNMQSEVEALYIQCFSALGWGYEPDGRHTDIVHIKEVYMSGGMFW